jgi:hypothetical protein
LAWNVPKARKLRTPGTRSGLSSRFSLTFGWPMRRDLGHAAALEAALPSPRAHRLMRATSFAWRSPVGKRDEHARDQPGVTPTRRTARAVIACTPRSVERADRRHHERRGHDRAAMLCAYCASAQGSARTPRSRRAAASVGADAWPTGCCMNALVQTMK